MSQKFYLVVFGAIVIAAAVLPAAAQPPTADASISKDRALRYVTLKAGKNVATTPQRGFFGTIFSLIVEQINDTKSAYNQISGLVNNQFADNDDKSKPKPNNGTAEAAKITRAEFLKILDRNFKGLARLRNLEWREARKDSWANLVEYKNEIFSGKKARNRR
ncbi:PREDICTED: uncharacterized protein LOC106100808 isoform X2 [Papilio polytes]|nr:PREDICTED: uncharacterized protein LOC106100808 isoform X2 [Papilio polytes]XP_013135307.1 PREDICTED: uncharacterized protein LOC106100808 isoform X2 [Papilio polytes]